MHAAAAGVNREEILMGKSSLPSHQPFRVVILGGGFAGIATATSSR
jgi:hypothetical protein